MSSVFEDEVALDLPLKRDAQKDKSEDGACTICLSCLDLDSRSSSSSSAAMGSRAGCGRDDADYYSV